MRITLSENHESRAENQEVKLYQTNPNFHEVTFFLLAFIDITKILPVLTTTL